MNWKKYSEVVTSDYLWVVWLLAIFPFIKTWFLYHLWFSFWLNCTINSLDAFHQWAFVAWAKIKTLEGKQRRKERERLCLCILPLAEEPSWINRFLTQRSPPYLDLTCTCGNSQNKPRYDWTGSTGEGQAWYLSAQKGGTGSGQPLLLADRCQRTF